MSTWSDLASSDDAALTGLDLEEGDVFVSDTSIYSVIDFIGEGCYGKVARCLNVHSKENVAVKILKKGQDNEKELSTLKAISALGADLTNTVRFYERFEHNGLTCLAFEMLDIDLFRLICKWHHPMTLSAIRTIAEQLLVALDALQFLGIVHTDIKPDNIMFVDCKNQPLRVKLIDFGLAVPVNKTKPGTMIQPIGYRAPEVSFGLPISGSVDMWGVGCVLAYLFLGGHLFPVNSHYHMIKRVVEIVGRPSDDLLQAGIYTNKFFKEEEAVDGKKWRFMTPEEYTEVNEVPVMQQFDNSKMPSSLDDLLHIYPAKSPTELIDRKNFIDLLKQLLHPDGTQRINPSRALQYPFFDLSSQSQDPDTTQNLNAPEDEISPVEHSAERESVSEVSQCSHMSTKMSPKSESSSSTESPSISESPSNSTTVHLEEEASKSSDEQQVPVSPEASQEAVDTVKPSAGRFKTMRKRIHRMFRGVQKIFCCCLCSPVED